MDSQHTPVKPVRNTRRRVDLWDRIKILFILGIVIGVILWTKVNAPFTDFGEAISEMSRESLGGALLVLFMLEVLRQLHYLVAERSAAYNTFWQERVFGGAERQLHKRTKPWTRFRVGRLFRLVIVLLIYGTIISLFASDISNPVQAIAETPRLIGQFMFFIVYAIFIFTIVIGQFVAIFWFLSRGGVDVVLPEEIETRYTDVWGQDHVLELVKENVGFLEKPDEIEAKGGYIPGGMLLWGPPGTGKTLIAQATAGEVGRPFVFVEPGSFINMFMGVGILKVKSLFRKLRKLSLRHGGVVVFFDEADALGSRGSLGQGGGPFQPMESNAATAVGTCNGFHYLSGASQEHILTATRTEPDASPEPRRSWIDRIIMGGMGMGGGGMGTLQALLTEISGLQKPRGLFNRIRKTMGMRPKPAPKYRIFIMMATNMPNALDEALLRPGRIDRIYKVGYPSKEGRLATLQGYLDKVQHTLTAEQIDDLAVKTPYYSGAKIKDLVNEALILAIRDDRHRSFGWDDIWKAKALKELGPAEDAGYIEREQHAVAVHEACHAVIGHLMKQHMVIDLATIERHSTSLGMVRSLQMEDRYTQWRSEYEADIMSSLASLAGERLFFSGDNSSGVSQDLSNATRLASYMVGLWGMSDQIASFAAMGQARFGTTDPSPDVLKRRQDAVEKVLKQLYDRTAELLEEHADKVLAVAAALEEHKTISGDDIAEIMGSEPGVLAEHHTESWTLADPKRAQISIGKLNPDGSVAAATPSPESVEATLPSDEADPS